MAPLWRVAPDSLGVMSAESDVKDLHAQAYAAYQQGRPTFVACLKSSAWGFPAGQMGAWMDSVDAVESAGWRLEFWETTTTPGGASSAFPVFRRSQSTPQDRPLTGH